MTQTQAPSQARAVAVPLVSEGSDASGHDTEGERGFGGDHRVWREGLDHEAWPDGERDGLGESLAAAVSGDSALVHALMRFGDLLNDEGRGVGPGDVGPVFERDAVAEIRKYREDLAAKNERVQSPAVARQLGDVAELEKRMEAAASGAAPLGAMETKALRALGYDAGRPGSKK